MIEITRPKHIKKKTIRLSGSKSLSNRFLILNEILALNLSFQNLSDSEDTQLLQKALYTIKGKTKGLIDVHHAGTDLRFLTAYLAVTDGEWILTGSERLKARPIGELVSALRTLGAEIVYLEKENFPPLMIRGKKLKGGQISIDSSVSSQFISALLLIAPKFEKGLELHLRGNPVSKPYIEMTLILLKSAGILLEEKGNNLKVIPSPGFLPPANFVSSSVFIESDWSSASYWYSICALARNAEIELKQLNQKSLQADSVLPEIYKDLGVKTTFKENSIVITSVPPVLSVFEYDFVNCPDIAQTLAVTCFGLGVKTKLSGLGTLKVKETDRILALKNELEKFGALINISDTSLEITGSITLQQRQNITLSDAALKIIRTYNDHRMAMSFAPLALLYNTLQIDDPLVVAKSYPSFWEDLKCVGFNVNLHP